MKTFYQVWLRTITSRTSHTVTEGVLESRLNNEAVLVKEQLLSREIRNVLAVRGPKRTREINFDNWRDELKNSEFRGISMAGNATTQVNLLLGMCPCDGYTLVKENGAVKLGWKDLCLLTASAWKPIHTTTSQ